MVKNLVNNKVNNLKTNSVLAHYFLLSTTFCQKNYIFYKLYN